MYKYLIANINYYKKKHCPPNFSVNKYPYKLANHISDTNKEHK